MFKKVIIPGEIANDTFVIQKFNKVIIDIPIDFSKAKWGYGHYFGRFYGHT